MPPGRGLVVCGARPCTWCCSQRSASPLARSIWTLQRRARPPATLRGRWRAGSVWAAACACGCPKPPVVPARTQSKRLCCARRAARWARSLWSKRMRCVSGSTRARTTQSSLSMARRRSMCRWTQPSREAPLACLRSAWCCCSRSGRWEIRPRWSPSCRTSSRLPRARARAAWSAQRRRRSARWEACC